MDVIFKVLSEEIKKPDSRFVFPSETASSLWARKICGFTGTRSVALNRFLAWDRFKEETVRAEVQDKAPVSAVIRRLFAEALVRKNAAALEQVSRKGTPDYLDAEVLPFHSLIPGEFAETGKIFAAQLAGILPSLKFLKKRRQGSACERDAEDRDFDILEKEYAHFLNRHGLFEPSWENPPLRDRTHRYFIFFPEAIEDFTEYEATLSSEPLIHLIYEEKKGDNAPDGKFRRYDSSRAEIRHSVLEIRRLHEEEDIPYEDMAVSVPGLEDMEPYLLREFALYNVPVRRRSGRPLDNYGTGKLFSLINDCVRNNFSFSSLKALLLDGRLPWRYPELNKELIQFGIKNNCVSGYREKGRTVDVWLEAFKTAPREERLSVYYKRLKENLCGISAARNFTEIRRRYFAFRGRVWQNETVSAEDPWTEYPASAFPGFLAHDRCSPEGNAVLARCIEELSALIQLEPAYPDLIPESPFNFYLSILKEKQYVPVQAEGGVNIFPYRVAAASPFTCHFVLNAAQDTAAVLYRPLKFLAPDKRKRLGVNDTDASIIFFRLYQGGSFEGFNSQTRISASDWTFSGWAIPHSYFSGGTGGALPQPADPFLLEQAWWAAGDQAAENLSKAAPEFPRRLFQVQKEGFDRWYKTLREQVKKPYAFLKGPIPPKTIAACMVEERIAAVQRGFPRNGTAGTKPYLRVSATDLNNFYYCPAFWFFNKILQIRDFPLEAKLLDDTSLGTLYHKILEKLFIHIRREDTFFNPGHMEHYRQLTGLYTREVIRDFPAFQGPLAVPILASQAEAIAKRLKALLETEAEIFSGYAIADLEWPLEAVWNELLLNGKLDRVSVSPEDDPVIIDYKTNSIPTAAQSTETPSSPLENFQMPVYIRLYEENTKKTAKQAFFISIHKHTAAAIFGKPQGEASPREKYQPTLDALEKYADHFAASVNALDFSAGEIRFDNCLNCDYKNICRTTFSLNAGEEKAHAF
jgi:hypothetical protein